MICHQIFLVVRHHMHRVFHQLRRARACTHPSFQVRRQVPSQPIAQAWRLPSSVQKATSSNEVCQCMAEGAHLRVFHAPKGYIWVHQQGYLPRNVQRYAPIQSIVLLIPKIKAHFVICVSRLTQVSITNLMSTLGDFIKEKEPTAKKHILR